MKFSVTLYYLYNLTFCVLHLSVLCLYKELKILQKEELTAVLFFILVVLEMYAKLKDQMTNRRLAPFISLHLNCFGMIMWAILFLFRYNVHVHCLHECLLS